MAATLSDERISDRPVKLLGRFRPDGTFSVREFYIARPESLYRIIYFCDTCHITTFAPGDCACCQQPTVPIEVLPTDPRIYHGGSQGTAAQALTCCGPPLAAVPVCQFSLRISRGR